LINIDLLYSLLHCRSWKSLFKPVGTPYSQIVEMVFLRIFHAFQTTKHIQNSAIRYFIVNVIVKVSSDEATLTKEHTYINKLNMVLVQVSLDLYL
jgi:hypothetical protein